MKDAMVSIEDRRFRSHIGVDPLGLMRAVFVAVRDQERARATSTITQQRPATSSSQLAHARRKVREAVLAMALESKFSKDQILELYLNKVYFGGGAYGIDSASRKFFSHPATDLSSRRRRSSPGWSRRPRAFSPTADATAAVRRANVVLRLMARNGKISAGRGWRSISRSAPARGKAQNSPAISPIGRCRSSTSCCPTTFEPIEVWTTLDVGMQRAAATAVKANVPRGSQGALVSLDRDGAVLAMVGGTDYVTTNYNRATDALRQPGSAWKIFVFLAALEAGYTPEDAVKDVPVTIDGWTPRNSDGGYAGQIDMRTAFAYSKNTVAAQLGNEVGFGTVASMARRFGITTPISTYPAMVLGSSETRVIDMTRAFAAVAAAGNSVEPYGYQEGDHADGELLYSHEKRSSTRLVPATWRRE
jgi:penicillin-binding protein 1A